MKTTKSIIIVLFVLLTAQIASAYYCPSTGRWLSRDPIGEPGFQALQEVRMMPKVANPILMPPSRWIDRDLSAEDGFKSLNQQTSSNTETANLYVFVSNDPANQIDPNGLFTLWLCMLVADRDFNPPGCNCITHKCYYICKSGSDYRIKEQPKCYGFPCLKKNFFID